MVSAGQVTRADDGSYTFPIPSDADLNAALTDLRDGKFIPPRMQT